jgi:hypothetical protein
MSIYFISGHRDLTHKEFQQFYAKHIMNAILANPKCEFVVGDYHGADTLAQEYLGELVNKYTEVMVTVYHMGDEPMNNPQNFHTLGDFKNDHQRDAAMTNASDKDIAWVRSGKKHSGTAQNILRRKAKDISHELGYTDAMDFIQGIVDTLDTHPQNNDEHEHRIEI